MQIHFTLMNAKTLVSDYFHVAPTLNNTASIHSSMVKQLIVPRTSPNCDHRRGELVSCTRLADSGYTVLLAATICTCSFRIGEFHALCKVPYRLRVSDAHRTIGPYGLRSPLLHKRRDCCNCLTRFKTQSTRPEEAQRSSLYEVAL